MDRHNLLIFASENSVEFCGHAFCDYKNIIQNSINVFESFSALGLVLRPLIVFDDLKLVISNKIQNQFELTKIIPFKDESIFYHLNNSYFHYLVKHLSFGGFSDCDLLFRPEFISNYINSNYTVGSEDFFIVDIRENASYLYCIQNNVVYFSRKIESGYLAILNHIADKYRTDKNIAKLIVKSCLFKTEMERMQIANHNELIPMRIISNDIFSDLQNDCLEFMSYFQQDILQNLLYGCDFAGSTFVVNEIASLFARMDISQVENILYEDICKDSILQIQNNLKHSERDKSIFYSYKKLFFLK